MTTICEWTSSLRTGDYLLVHWRQDNEALFVSLYETIHRVVFILIISDLLPNALQIKANSRVTNHHLETKFSYFWCKVYYLLCHGFITIANRKSILYVVCYLPNLRVRQSLSQYLSPIRLVSLPKHTFHGIVNLIQTRNLDQGHVCRLEVFLNCCYKRLKDVLVKIDDPIKVQFWTEQIKEDILAVTFVQLRSHIG